MSPAARRVRLEITDAALRRRCERVLSATPGLEPAADGDVVLLSADRYDGVARSDGAGGTGDAALRVVVVGPDDRDAARRALTHGVDVVLATDRLDALPQAIAAAANGLVSADRRFGSLLGTPPLTDREKQVLGLVLLGLTNQEIADQLVVAESTVKKHLHAAYRRLGVRSRREAAGVIADLERGYGHGILGITPKRTAPAHARRTAARDPPSD